MTMLFYTLLRFRVHKIAITADIEAAFLQIGIKEADRDVLGVLWFDDVEKEKPSIVQYRYCRLVFGLPCSPAILGETIHKHIDTFALESPQVANILKRLYADDLSYGCETTVEALESYRTAKEMMLQGGFNLRKWTSNNKKVFKEINKSEKAIDQQKSVEVTKVNEDDESYTKYAVGTPSSDGNSKVLGVNWNHETDRFDLDLSHLTEYSKSLPLTKRSVLKLAAKMFDPLGLISLFTRNLKGFFQELCIKN